MPPAPEGLRSFPPSTRLAVVELATRSDPAQAGCPAGTWSLDDLARALANEAHHRAVSRSTIQRILAEADLKPHRQVYWLNRHGPDFSAQMQDICRWYLDARRLWDEERQLLLSCDEKTGIFIRQRLHPTPPAEPGRPRRVEHHYVRRGMTQLTATLVIPTGQVATTLTQTHNGEDFVRHLRQVVPKLPAAEKYHWFVDNNRTHGTLGVCEAVAELSGVSLAGARLSTGKERREWLANGEKRHVFHFTPVHGSWLNQVEMWFGVLTRRLLRRDDFGSREEFEKRFGEWVEYYNKHLAHPYRWTFTGQPLVRDTPGDRTAKQRRKGRAWLGRRPRTFRRLFDPPRTYRRTPAP